MKDSKLIENRLKNFLFLLIFFFVNETICGFKTFLYSSYDCFFFSLRLKASGNVFREVLSLAEVLPSVPRVEAVAVVDLAGAAAVVGDVRVQETGAGLAGTGFVGTDRFFDSQCLMDSSMDNDVIVSARMVALSLVRT